MTDRPDVPENFGKTPTNSPKESTENQKQNDYTLHSETTARTPEEKTENFQTETTQTHSPSNGEKAAETGITNKIYTVLAIFAPLTLLAVLALQTVFSFDSRQLWFSDEIRYANVFEHVIHAKKWIVLYLNGIPYPDKPPVYFWLLSGIYTWLEELSPRLFFMGAALSGLLLTWVTYALSRFVAGTDKKTGLTAGLIMLSCFYIMGVAHYSRMDLLFATLITISHICLYKGWQQDKAFGWLIAGFAFAGVATLTKGPLGLAFPILSMVLFNVWRGKIRRMGAWDAAIGFGVLLVICLTWVSAAYFTEEPAYLRNIVEQQIVKRATNTWHHGQPWWHYLATLPAAFMPWTLILLVLPWSRIFTKKFYKDVWNSRTPENMGIAYLWITVLSGFTLLSVVSIKIVIYLLPLFPPLAVLTARSLHTLTAGRSRILYRTFALLLLTLGIGVGLAQFFNPWAIDIAGWYYLSALAIGFAVALWFSNTQNPLTGLLIWVIMLTAWMQPLTQITAPSLDAVMSPKAQAEVMKEYIAKGYTPASFKIYSGTYTYYAKQNITETGNWEELHKVLNASPNIVLGIRQKHWIQMQERGLADDFTIVHKQFIVDHQPRNEYLLTVCSKVSSPPEEAVREQSEKEDASSLEETIE